MRPAPRTSLPYAVRPASTLLALALAAAPASAQFPLAFRPIDGTGNNQAHPGWGAVGAELLRLESIEYADGVGAPAGASRPGARAISNAVCSQAGSVENDRHASDMVWQWGQFVDHDLDLTGAAAPAEPFPIPVPTGDPHFDPFHTGTQVIDLSRSAYVMSGAPAIRQQVNQITAYLDASMVYGSDAARALELRRLDGTGRLKTSAGGLLPFNVNGFPNAPTEADPSLFLAGDVRANEQNGLTAMHTLFVREHNWWAVRFGWILPWASDDLRYQLARAMVAAEVQAITYREWLPVLLGPNALPPYQGYDPGVDAGVRNVFSTACFRLGHSLLSPQLMRLDRDMHMIPQGHLPLREAFFNPAEISALGIDPLLRGLCRQHAQELDVLVVDDVRNFLFGPPGSGGFDLVSLNIQRGRDHGLPAYNHLCADVGLPPCASFADVTSDRGVRARLASAYANVDEIDAWVGGLAEDHRPQAMVGDLLFHVLRDQFRRVRDGDRFWYQHDLPPALQWLIERQTLARILRRNTRIRGEIPANVFLVPQAHASPP